MNDQLIKNFKILQLYYQSVNDKGRTISYGKIIYLLRNLDFEITDIDQVKNIKYLGKAALAKIKEYLETGSIELVENKREIMKYYVENDKEKKTLTLFETIWGVGPKTAKKFYDLGFRTIQDIKDNSYLLNKKQKIGLKYREDLLKKIPRDIITSIGIYIRYVLDRTYGKNTYQMEVAGSYRRGKSESGDIDILITSNYFTLKDVVNILQDKKLIVETESMINEKFMGIVNCPKNFSQFMRMDIEFVPVESWASALLYFTGSKNTNIFMRSRAKKMGYVLNQHGIFQKDKRLDINTEEDIFEILKLRYLKPQER